MHDEVLQAHCRLLGQIQIEPEAIGGGVATPPLGFHPADCAVREDKEGDESLFGLKANAASLRTSGHPIR